MRRSRHCSPSPFIGGLSYDPDPFNPFSSTLVTQVTVAESDEEQKAGGKDKDKEKRKVRGSGAPVKPPAPPSLPQPNPNPGQGVKQAVANPPRSTRNQPPANPVQTTLVAHTSAQASNALPPAKELKPASSTAAAPPPHPHPHPPPPAAQRKASGSKLTSRSEVSMDGDNMDLEPRSAARHPGPSSKVVKAREPPAIVLQLLQGDQQEMRLKGGGGRGGSGGLDPSEGTAGPGVGVGVGGSHRVRAEDSDVHESSGDARRGRRGAEAKEKEKEKEVSAAMPPPPPPALLQAEQEVSFVAASPLPPAPPTSMTAPAPGVKEVRGQGQGQPSQLPSKAPVVRQEEASRRSAQPENSNVTGAGLDALVGMLTAGQDDDEDVVQSTPV